MITRKRWVTLIGLALGALIVGCTAASKASNPAPAANAVEESIIEPATPTPSPEPTEASTFEYDDYLTAKAVQIPGLMSPLSDFYQLWQLNPDQAIEMYNGESLKIKYGRVEVEIYLKSVSAAEQVSEQIADLGGWVSEQNQSEVYAMLPISKLAEAAALDGVRSINVPSYSHPEVEPSDP